MDTSSLRPLRRRVLIINSRAKWVAGWGSSGLENKDNKHVSTRIQRLIWLNFIIDENFSMGNKSLRWFWDSKIFGGQGYLMTMLLSRGSPGTICQWWKTCRQNAWPCVCVRKSVSKPNESIAGTNALIVYRGEPGTGASWVTWPENINVVSMTLFMFFFFALTKP